MTAPDLAAPPSGRSLMTPPDSRPAEGTRPRRKPPRWWTLALPCLLTLPVSAWSFLIAAISGLESCFDTCMPTIPLITPIGFAELILAVGAIVTLIAGLALPTWRRALRRVLWTGCALAWLGGGYLYAWASTHP